MKLLINIVLALAVLALCLGTPAFAGVLFDTNLCARVDNPAPPGTTVLGSGLFPTGGGVTGPTDDDCQTRGSTFPAFPFVFTLPSNGTLILTVTDQGNVRNNVLLGAGDVYEVLIDGFSLGFTSQVPIGSQTLSSGVFVVSGLVAADYTFAINDTLLSYFAPGAAGPYGGTFSQNLVDYSPAGLHVTAELVPEPASILLLGAGLLGLAGFARKRLKV
jgi:PEP-CTERM motif